MLKIKDNIDLKELEKFGFGVESIKKPNEDKYTFFAYDRMRTKRNENKYGCIRTTYKIVKVYVKDRTIHFFNLSGETYNKNWANDLIQAGLVEKVGE